MKYPRERREMNDKAKKYLALVEDNAAVRRHSDGSVCKAKSKETCPFEKREAKKDDADNLKYPVESRDAKREADLAIIMKYKPAQLREIMTRSDDWVYDKKKGDYVQRPMTQDERELLAACQRERARVLNEIRTWVSDFCKFMKGKGMVLEVQDKRYCENYIRDNYDEFDADPSGFMMTRLFPYFQAQQESRNRRRQIRSNYFKALSAEAKRGTRA